MAWACGALWLETMETSFKHKIKGFFNAHCFGSPGRQKLESTFW